MRIGNTWFWAPLVVLVVVIYAILAIRSEPVSPHPFSAADEVLVMAHRGGQGLWPENTLFAFERAAELGADVLDMDLHSTADGVLVAIHDKTVDRTTNGSGEVGELTLAQLKVLDAGSRWTADRGASFPFRGKGITVPALEEVFRAFPQMRMSMEIKQEEPSIAAPLCAMVRTFGLSDQVLVSSFSAEVLEVFRAACPEVATSAAASEALLFWGMSRLFLDAAYQPGAQVLQVPEHLGRLDVVDNRFISMARGHNIEVYVWTVDEIDDMQRLLELGVDGVITSYPDRLLALLGRPDEGNDE